MSVPPGARALSAAGVSMREELPAVDDGDAIAQLVCLLHVVRGHDDGAPCGVQLRAGSPTARAAPADRARPSARRGRCTRGSWINARAIIRRCCCPPDSSSTLALRRLRDGELLEERIARSRGAAASRNAEIGRVKHQVLEDVEAAIGIRPLRHDADALAHGDGRLDARRRLRRARRPPVGSTRVVRMPIVVVFPAPFGPRRPKNSPDWTSRSSPTSATTSRGPAPRAWPRRRHPVARAGPLTRPSAGPTRGRVDLA